MNRSTPSDLPSLRGDVHPAPDVLLLDACEAKSDGQGVTPVGKGGRGNIVHVERSTLIRVPARQVFAFMERPEHQVQITPSLSEVWDVRRSAAGRLSARATYRLAGLDLQVRVQVTDYRPARRLSLVLTGRVRGHVRWEFRTVEAGTLFTYAVAYRLPAPLVRGVAESYLRTYVEGDLDSTLSYLRARLEDGVVVPAVHRGRPYLTGRPGGARVITSVDAVSCHTRPGMPGVGHSPAITEDAVPPSNLGSAPVPPKQPDGPHVEETGLPAHPT